MNARRQAPILAFDRTFSPLKAAPVIALFLFSCTPLHAEPATKIGPATAAPEEPDLAAIYNDANRAYTAGDYKGAIDGFLSLLKQIPPEAQTQFEPLFFTLGAAYFQLKDYDRAISTFQNYLTKFPKSPRITDVRFAMAQAHFAARRFAEAAAQFLALENVPALRDQTMLLAGQALKESGKTAECITVLDRLISAGVKSSYAEEAAITLATMQVETNPEKARKALQVAQKNVAYIDNIARLNTAILQMADALLSADSNQDALDLYRSVRLRPDLIAFQSARVAAQEAQVEKNLEAMRAHPESAPGYLAANADLKTRIEQSKALLEEFRKAPDFRSGLLLRQAQAFYGLDKKREAAIVYRDIVDKLPDAPERETALFGQLVSLAELSKAKEAQSACDLYLREFPKGPNASTAGYLKGATALEAEDYAAAETFFGIALTQQPKSDFRERMLLQLANAKFSQGKYEEARAEYGKYLAEFPKGMDAEEATYRGTLSLLFDGKFEPAMEKLSSYLSLYPKGAYVSDARYRLAVCKYAASLYDDVVADCLAWDKDFPNDPMSGESLALLGDAYAALDKAPEAIDAYVRAEKAATTDEVLGYAIMEAAKLMQKAGEWPRLSAMFEEFVREKPENQLVVAAAFWIAKAKAREGKADEAKAFIAETIAQYVNDRNRPAVEQLLTQLAQLCSKTKSPADSKEDAAAVELNKLLTFPDTQTKPVTKARALFAQSELARLRKRPADQERLLAQITATSKPGDLSAPLLAACGEYLVAQKQFDKAVPYFDELMREFFKTDYIDYAYWGLGEAAYAKGKYEEALRYFTAGLDDIAPAAKIKDLTIGKAQSELALGKLDEADKTFAQIAAVREWRGDATALSVYSLGQIEMQRGDWPKAIAYFQRVYVAYRRYIPWVAKSYLRSAECFQRLGKIQEARNTYGEMLLNEKLKGTPEVAEAEKKLKELGPS